MITTNIRPLNTHTISGNVTTQSQHSISGAGISGETETDPIFRHSPAYTITEQDIINWDAASGGIDMSAYVTHTFLSAQAYLTSESDPIFSASPASGITNEDIENWNAGGAVDLSSYVTYDYLSAQAYLTSVTFPDYSNTYQAKGDYITPEVLAQQSYLTTETEPAFNGSPASSITDTDIANWNAAAGTIDMSAYVTKSELVTQSYITINDVVFPDYSNTYQAKGNYLTNETDPVFSASPAAGITTEDIENWNAGGAVDLSSYVTYEYLSAQSYIKASTTSSSYTINFDKYLYVRNYGGDIDISNYTPIDNIYDYCNVRLMVEPRNNSTYSAWIEQYVQHNSANTYFVKNTLGARNGQLQSIIGVRPDLIEMKTDQVRVDGPVYLKNGENYYLAASYDYVLNQIGTYVISQAYLTSETDPVFSASPAAGITAQDITNWNNGAGIDLSSYVTYEYLSAQSYLTSVTFPDYSNTYQAKGDYVTNTTLANQSYVTKNELVAQSYVTSTSLSGMAYVQKSELAAQSYVTSAALSNCGYVQIKLVTQSQYVDRQDNILYVITDAPPIS